MMEELEEWGANDALLNSKRPREEKRRIRRMERRLRRRIFGVASHRRRLQAAGILLCLGSFGITYLCMCLAGAFGLTPFLISHLGHLGANAVVCLVSLILSLMLLYPLWLGMRSYAVALVQGTPEPDRVLFSFYSDRRQRCYAIRQGLFGGLRALLIFGLVMVGGVVGCRLAELFTAAGDVARAALTLGITAALLCVIPLVGFLQWIDFALCRYLYCEEPTLTLWQARRISVRAMKGRRLAFIRLGARYLPALLLSLVLFGVGIPLFVLPKFLLSAAGFVCRPTYQH